jgi:uncharacterized protein
MRIELESLARTDGRFAQTFEPEQFALSDERVCLVQPATVTGQLRQSQGEITVSGHVSARVQVECARCLKMVELPIETNFELDYVTPQTYEASPAAELKTDDMSLSIFDGEALDIDELFDEQIMLTLPSRVLCNENCKGLCPVCGGDRNTNACSCELTQIDPRWRALKELVNGK